MPARVIREGFLDSDAVAAAGEAAEAFFLRLALRADDYGRFDGRITVICRACWPLGGPTEDDVAKRLEALIRAGIVQRYEVNGKPYLLIPKFRQRMRTPRSKFPDPPAGCQPDDGQTPDVRRPDLELDLESEAEAEGPRPAAAKAPLPERANPTPESEAAAKQLSAEGMTVDADDSYLARWLRDGYALPAMLSALSIAKARPRAPIPMRPAYFDRVLRDHRAAGSEGAKLDNGRKAAEGKVARTNALLAAQRAARERAVPKPATLSNGRKRKR